MRETKFRGKLDLSTEELKELEIPHKNGWVIGKLIGDEKRPVIVGPIGDLNEEYFNTEWWGSVIPESVGQYTGLKDKNCVEIYEKDVLNGWVQSHWHSGLSKFVKEVKYDERLGRYNFDGRDIDVNEEEFLEIIGNIYDNPKLLEVAK